MSCALAAASLFVLAACKDEPADPDAPPAQSEANVVEAEKPPAASCGAWDAKGEGHCRQILGSAWNGSSCEQIYGCDCVGADCAKVADNACADLAKTCAAPSNVCDARRVGCRMAEPKCPKGQTASVTVDPNVPGSIGCWGPCVDIGTCRCDPAEGSKDCPADHACWGTHLACGPLVR